MNLWDQLGEEGIRLRRYTEGEHKTTCPKCSNARKNKADPCLSVKIDDKGATWNCHHCGWQGGAVETEEHQPVPRSRPKPDLTRVKSATTLPAKALQWFAGRKIRESTLSAAGVGWTSFWFAAKNGDAPCLVFPYRKPGGEIVNAKFRTGDKEFAQIKHGDKILYAIDRADPSHDELIIVEGEIDQLSLAEAGVMNAVSVPDGAPKAVKDGAIDPSQDRKFAYLWACKEDLDRFSRIVLACDSDEPGRALTEELARRLGRERCWIVTWPEGCKDANDVLMKHDAEELRICIARAQPYPIKSVFDVGAFETAVLNLYRQGRSRGVSTGFHTLDEFYTVAPGQLTIVSGMSNAGKSEVVDAIAVNLALRHGWRLALCSFENPPDEHITKLAEKYLEMPFWDGPTPRMHEGDLRRAMAWLHDHFWFIRADDDAPTIDWLLDAATAVVQRIGIRGLVIDPYNEIEHKRPDRMTETEYVSHMLGKVKRFAQNHGAHVWFIAHPAKPQKDGAGKYPVPTLYDIAGSANFVNKADVGMIVHRDPKTLRPQTEIYIRKVRFKWVGRIGQVTLDYDPPTGVYRDQMQQSANWTERDL